MARNPSLLTKKSKYLQSSPPPAGPPLPKPSCEEIEDETSSSVNPLFSNRTGEIMVLVVECVAGSEVEGDAEGMSEKVKNEYKGK